MHSHLIDPESSKDSLRPKQNSSRCEKSQHTSPSFFQKSHNIFGKMRKTKLLQELVKVLVVSLCLGLVIEYNYSIFRSALHIRDDMGLHSTIENENGKALKFSYQNSGSNATHLPPPGYLVFSDHCRMLDVDPFNPGASRIFKKKNYTSCSTDLPITKIVFDINLHTYSLHMDEHAKRQLVGDNDDVSCCYQIILRAGMGNSVDREFRLTRCIPFHRGHVLPFIVDGVVIVCESLKTKKQVQRDAHFLVREKPEVVKKLKSFKNKQKSERPVSVLMLGIDSISRFNLRRTMPKTAMKLVSNNWFELSGYNKVDDNTLPNFLAILSGYSLKTAQSRCDFENPGGLNDCNLIWDDFNKYGYVTGYAEDETWMSTFDYHNLKGFKKPPVDYYHRPFMMAIEKTLPILKQNGMTFCVGLRHAAEYIYDFALELASRFKGHPYFGLFWTNTFSHNSFDDPSSMDDRVSKYIDEMKNLGILDDSIVILFSDHGMRFGQLRYLREGFLEERLPFVFIWLPHWFRAKHPDFAEALRQNRHRLTNPYDLHMTLKHIIKLGRGVNLPQAVDCPNCQSLFFPVPIDRSCKDIAINDHWCTCIPYENVSPYDIFLLRGLIFVVNYLNSYLKDGGFTPRCRPIEFLSLVNGRRKVELDQKIKSNETIYLVTFTGKSESEVEPKFEASLSYSETSKSFKVIGSVSRLDAYAESSKCISNQDAKKYCICDENYLEPT